MYQEKQENNLIMECMEQINDAFCTNPDASTISEDFFNKALHVYGDEHFPLSDKVNESGKRIIIN